MFIDSELKFGASTRTYIIRERPQINKHMPTMLQLNSSNNESINEKDRESDLNSSNTVYTLPETEAELDVLYFIPPPINSKII